MTSARRICDAVEISLNDEFLVADSPSVLGPRLCEAEMEECFGGLDLSGFDQLIQKIMMERGRYDPGIDIIMAVDLHKSLPLTRRQASDRRFWDWLGIVHAPDFVAWRWRPSGDSAKRNRARFCGDRVRQAFARLWWAVELTKDGDDYTLTEKLLNLGGFQDIYEAIFGRAFGGYRPAIATFIEVIGNKREAFIRSFSRELGYALTTSVLETMDEAQLQNLMIGLVERMEAKAT